MLLLSLHHIRLVSLFPLRRRLVYLVQFPFLFLTEVPGKSPGVVVCFATHPGVLNHPSLPGGRVALSSTIRHGV